MLTKEAINRYSLQLCLLGVTERGYAARGFTPGAVNPALDLQALKSETVSIPLPLSSAVHDRVLEPCLLQTADVLKWRMVYVRFNMPQVQNHVIKC